MSTSGIHGPGGPPGPGDGPAGPDGPTGAADAGEVTDVDEAGAGDRARAADAGATAGVAGADPVVALAAELDAGRISPDQALARLLDDGLGADLDPAQRAELESLFADLLANDPYLAGLARDLGAAPVDAGDGAAPLPGGGGDRG